MNANLIFFGFELAEKDACVIGYCLMFILNRDSAGTKIKGGQRPQFFQNITPKSKDLRFIAFSYHFQKIRGSADPIHAETLIVTEKMLLSFLS